MTPRAYILHALSPLHAGVGQAAELIDLPIARMKGTNIPFVPGSSIKGVLRDAHTPDTIEAVFGPDYQNANKHAGALVCTDARLLALPVRSFVGTFAYVTSPLLLTLAARDIANAPKIPPVTGNARCMAPSGLGDGGKVYLEDLDLTLINPDSDFNSWQARIANCLGDTGPLFSKRFAVVDDETMGFLWETATQLDQRVRIDDETRVVAKGALWLEESLPPETLLIGQLLAEKRRSSNESMQPAAVLDAVLPVNGDRYLQFGGKSTVGRGRCRMVAL